MIYHLFQSGAAFVVDDVLGRSLSEDLDQEQLLALCQELALQGNRQGENVKFVNRTPFILMGAKPEQMIVHYHSLAAMQEAHMDEQNPLIPF